MPHVLLMSARDPPNADVVMAFDDVSVDSVNIDQANSQLGPRPGQRGPPVSLTASLDLVWTHGCVVVLCMGARCVGVSVCVPCWWRRDAAAG